MLNALVNQHNIIRNRMSNIYPRLGKSVSMGWVGTGVILVYKTMEGI